MKQFTIKLERIKTELGTVIDSNLFPKSGFFELIRTESHTKISDLVFVDKEFNTAFFVCPMIDFERIFEIDNIPEQELFEKNNQQVDKDFVLKFAKILLSKK